MGAARSGTDVCTRSHSNRPDLNRRPLAPKASGDATDTLDFVAFLADAAQTAHETFTGELPSVSAPPVNLLGILAQLAALPPQSRAVLAALLTPPQPATPTPPRTPRPGDDDPDRLHAGYEGRG